MKIKLAMFVLLVAIVVAAHGATANSLKFIADNFPKGIAEARQRNLPVFVEVWAPW